MNCGLLIMRCGIGMQGWEIAMCSHALKLWEAWLFACLLSKFENHVHGLLVIRRGVEIQGYKEAMCSRGASKL